LIQQTYNDIVTPELLEGAIENNAHPGFLQDYHVLHCLLRKYQPKRFFEIGCNMGDGTKIIKNALGVDSQVFSLDLPTELAHVSLQHPISEGKGDSVGHRCNLPFTLVRGDSMTYDYAQHYPIDGWFCDGEHNYDNPLHESKEMIKSGAGLIVWHDSDIAEVYKGITDAFEGNQDYELYRVQDTRIAYALRK
jgi:hypothetical protein